MNYRQLELRFIRFAVFLFKDCGPYILIVLFFGGILLATFRLISVTSLVVVIFGTAYASISGKMIFERIKIKQMENLGDMTELDRVKKEYWVLENFLLALQFLTGLFLAINYIGGSVSKALVSFLNYLNSIG